MFFILTGKKGSRLGLKCQAINYFLHVYNGFFSSSLQQLILLSQETELSTCKTQCGLDQLCSRCLNTRETYSLFGTIQNFVPNEHKLQIFRSANNYITCVHYRNPELHHMNLVKYGHRSFSYPAPFLWNSLPVQTRQASSLHSFKSLLKTLVRSCLFVTCLYVIISFTHCILYCSLYALRGFCMRRFTNDFILFFV